MDFLQYYAREISGQLNGELSPETIQQSFNNIINREIGFLPDGFQKTVEAEMLIVNIISTTQKENLKDFILQNL